MASLVDLCVLVAVLACLLQSAVSDHKKKIIVKVPHVIKHIHYTHYKPVHVHKVKAKKVEHHHHDEHGEGLSSWAHSSRKGVSKAHGSFSHLKPILVPHDGQGHKGHQKQEHEYGIGQDFGDSREYGQEDSWKSSSNAERFRSADYIEVPKGERGKWTPIDLANWMNRPSHGGDYSEDWYEPQEELPEFRGKTTSGKLNKKKKLKQLKFKTKYSSQEEDDGWKPIMNFKGWRDFEDVGYSYDQYHDDQFIHSGEEQSGGSRGRYAQEEREVEETSQKKKKKQRKYKNKSAKRGKWSKQIDVHEPNSEEEPQPLQYQPLQQQARLQQSARPVQMQPQVSPSIIQPSQILPQQLYLQPQPQPQHTSWPQPLPQQPLSTALWHSQEATRPQTPQPSKLVWSGHHLQLPKHSMWYVQQHLAPASSVQSLSVNQGPVPVQPTTQTPLFSMFQHPPSQLQQESSLHLSSVLPTSWPITQGSQGHPQAKQQWQQTVQTSGSAYKVEVINHVDHKNKQH